MSGLRGATLGTRKGLLLVFALLTSWRQAQGLYHISSEILHWFSHTAAKRPSLMRFKEVKEHYTRTAVPLATITAGANGLHHATRKPVVLFVFGEHAREVITSEVAIWLARMLVDGNSTVYTWPELGKAFERAQISSNDNNSSSSSSSSSSSRQDWPATARVWVQDILQKLEVQIVPIETLDSRRQVEEGQLCVRKNARNVDLNRNWPFAWQKADPSDEQYGGTNPFSEPQSRLMKQIFDACGKRLLGVVNTHSGEWALYTPWDSKPAYGAGMPVDMPELVATVGRICNCKAGPAGAVSGYLAFGSSMDYLYVQRQVPYPLTVEVYGGGGVGKLAPDETNKPLTRFRVIERPTLDESSTDLETTTGRRMLQLSKPQQQQQQWGRQALQFDQQLQTGREQQHQETAAAGSRSLQQQLQLQPQGSNTALPTAAVIANIAGTAAEEVSILTVGAAGFTHGPRLPQLQQQAHSQLSAGQQLNPPGHGGHSAGQNLPDDAILSLVAGASADLQACFYAFNPYSEADYRRVVADWLAAFVLMMKHMTEGEAMKSVVAAAVADGGHRYKLHRRGGYHRRTDHRRD